MFATVMKKSVLFVGQKSRRCIKYKRDGWQIKSSKKLVVHEFRKVDFYLGQERKGQKQTLMYALYKLKYVYTGRNLYIFGNRYAYI